MTYQLSFPSFPVIQQSTTSQLSPYPETLHIAMSGFEVAGVVLGTLPLAISALEHYRDGLRVIQRWRKFERELQSLIRNLETERAKLQNVCEMLLTGLVSHSRIEAMVDNPLGDLWLEEGIRKKVRVRLWRSWSVFEKNLQEMNGAIDRLMDALGDTTKVNVRTGLLQNTLLYRTNKGRWIRTPRPAACPLLGSSSAPPLRSTGPHISTCSQPSEMVFPISNR